MELSQSTSSDNRKPWLQYSLAISLGSAALVVFMLFHGAANASDFHKWFPLSAILLSGLIFSFLGIFAMVKDNHKGLGIASLAAGSILVGIAPFVI